MRFLPLLLVLSFLPASVLAHGDQPSFERETDGYLIDIGYDRVGIRPGEKVTFNFDLYNEDATEFASFTEVQVKIQRAGVTIIEEVFANDGVNVPAWGVTFPEEGEYVLHVAYVQNGELLVEDTFDVPVGENYGAVARMVNLATPIIAVVLVVIGFIVIIMSFMRRRTLTQSM